MLLIAASLLLAVTSASVDDRIKSEIDRLDALLKSEEPTVSKQLSELPKIYRDMLDKARAAKTSQVRLYRLRPAYGGIEGLAFIREHQDATKDIASLQKLWKEMEPRFRKAPAPRGTFLERAVQEMSTNRAEKLFNASIAYAKIDNPESALGSGMYYLSDAAGSLKYRDFALSVASDGDRTRVPGEKSLRSAYDEVQGAAIRSFEKDPTARTMLQTNAKLKEARELLDAKQFEAATIALLEARYELSKRDPNQAAMPAALKTNDGVTALFNEIAELETADNARAIRNEVLPLYASLPGRKITTQPRNIKPVTVTLIRWPYT